MTYNKNQLKSYPIILVALILFITLIVFVGLIIFGVLDKDSEKLTFLIPHAKVIGYGGLIGGIFGLIIGVLNKKRKELR